MPEKLSAATKEIMLDRVVVVISGQQRHIWLQSAYWCKDRPLTYHTAPSHADDKNVYTVSLHSESCKSH